MKTLFSFLFLFLNLSSWGTQLKQPEASDQFSGAVSYTIPAGWTKSSGEKQADKLLTLSHGAHSITIRLSGEPKSRYKNGNEFLAGFEARSADGTRPKKIAQLKISGKSVLLFSRKIAVHMSPPDTAGPAEFAVQEFCVIPAGNKFFILTYSSNSSIPDPDYNALAAWRTFLTTFRIKKL